MPRVVDCSVIQINPPKMVAEVAAEWPLWVGLTSSIDPGPVAVIGAIEPRTVM